MDEPYALFVEDHPSWECSDWRDSRICETRSPLVSECVADLPCDSASATFRDGKLVAVSYSYRDDSEWRHLLSKFLRQSPASLVVLPIIGKIETRAWRWRSEQGHLTFVFHYGRDVYGNPVRRPYSIEFGPEPFAPDVAGRLVHQPTAWAEPRPAVRMVTLEEVANASSATVIITKLPSVEDNEVEPARPTNMDQRRDQNGPKEPSADFQ